VLIEDGRIVSVTGGDPGVNAAREIDAGGMTVMPGMIDTHVHITGSPNINQSALAFLELGFTTIADLGGNLGRLSEFHDRNATQIPGPRILTSVSITGPGGHPVTTVCQMFLPEGSCDDIVEVGDPVQAREIVRRYAESGVDFIKTIYQDSPPGTMISDDALLAIAQEAEAVGLPFIVHASIASDALRAIELGADRMAHAPVQPEATVVDFEALGRSLDQGSVAVATTAHFVAPIIDDSGASTTFGGQPFTESNLRAMEEHLARIRALWDVGVTIAFGTDSFVPDPTRRHQE
jgi:imidazolonepropionase-like amidohydrolase